jgi:hypothetical protein
MGDSEDTLLMLEELRAQVVETICGLRDDAPNPPRRDAWLAKHGAELDTVILSVLTRIDAEDAPRFAEPLIADQPRTRPRPPTLDEILRTAVAEVVAEMRALPEHTVPESDVDDQRCSRGLRAAAGVARNGFLREFRLIGESAEAGPSAADKSAEAMAGSAAVSARGGR